MEENHGRQIVLIAGPFQGHLNPILQLANALHSRGFSITIAHSTLISPTNHDFTFFPIPDGLSRIDASSMLVLDLINEINVRFKVPLKEKLGKMMKKHRIACLIYDSIIFGAESVANDLGLTSIVFETVCAGILVTNTAYPLLKQKGYIPLQDSMSQDLLPTEYQPFRYKDLPIYNFQHYETFLEMTSTMTRTKTSSAIILNTIDCLERPFLSKLNHLKRPIPIFPVGPLHKIMEKHPSKTSLFKEDTSCITWLNQQAPSSVIYASTGSLSEIEDKELVETGWGLANSEQPFLWVLRPGSIKVVDEKWMSRLLGSGFEKVVEERGCVVEWAPQKEVLMHKAVGGFWSHCGWNSTLESVCEGVPMICWPRVADQNMNSRYVSYVWRVGFELEKMERGEIEKTVRKLMVGKEGKEMRGRALCLKMEIEDACKEGGSSYTCLNKLVKFLLSL